MSTQSTILNNLDSLGFDTTSSAALVPQIAQGVGEAIDDTLTEFTNTKNSILSIINDQKFGKAGYYVSSAKAFQYGDNLIIDSTTLNLVYATIDTTKQIISQAAFGENVTGASSQLYLKIATLNPLTGVLGPLNSPQLAAFTTYFLNFTIPGLPVSIINLPANILSFQGVLTYYSTYDLSTLKTLLSAALIKFRNSFNFNGTFYTGDLEDYIKANVPGVRNFFLYGTSIDNIPFQGSTVLQAGYFDFLAIILQSITNNITFKSVTTQTPS